MFKKIPGNLNFDLFPENLLAFYQILLLNCYETMEKNDYWAILLKKAPSLLRLMTSLLSLITISHLITFSFSFISFLCWGERVITMKRDRGIKKL